MSHDPLELLLRSADASSAAPPLPADLPGQVRDLLRRRRRRNALIMAGAATLAVPLLAVALLWPYPPREVAIDRPVPPTVPIRLDIAQLNLQAELHDQTAARLLASADALPVWPTSMHDRPVLAEVREQRDRAALILVYEAERATRASQPHRALSAYRRAIELFPQTYWADVARRRLKEMPT